MNNLSQPATSSDKKKRVLGEFIVGKTIGQGAFSKVKIGYHKETGTKVAIKVINKLLMAQKQEKALKKSKKKEVDEKSTSASYMAQIQNEVQLLMRLDHPNIIKLYQMIETKEECYVIMEYAPGGELINYIASKGRLSENEARKYFRQLISSIDHCHSANVVHRDLKLENLLLNTNRDLLLSDFGLGRTFNDDELLKTFCGTPNYAAAELVSGIPYVGNKSDIWAMGVVLYVMVTGSPPFKGDSINALYSKIRSVDYYIPSVFSQELKSLFEKILVKNPNERADMNTLREDAWVNWQEISYPPSLAPLVQKDIHPSAAAKSISGITGSENMTVYTFHAYQSTFNPAKESAGITTRRSSILSFSDKPTIGRSRRLSAPMPNFNGIVPSSVPNDQIIGVNTNGRRLSRVFSMKGASFHNEMMSSPSSGEFGKGNPFQMRRRASVSVTPATSRPLSSKLNPKELMNIPSSMHKSDSKEEESLLTDRPKLRARAMSASFQSKVSTGISNGVNIIKDEYLIRNHSSLMKAQSQCDDPDPFMFDEDSKQAVLDEESELHEEDETGSEKNPISDQAIIEWHKIHRPAKEIRTIKWTFNSKTTSSLLPSIIFQHIHNSLINLSGIYKDQLKYTRVEEYYMMFCELKVLGAQEAVTFEVEICKVWMLKLHGVRVKRISGDAIQFKDIFTKFVDNLKL